VAQALVRDTEGNNTLLSIVTICRDDADGLLDTRASVLAQTSTEWEHIVVAARSRDNSHTLAASMTDFRTRVICEEARGIYPAMNTGLEACQGEWVVFLNSGDSLASTRSVEAAMSRLKSTNAGCVVFGGFVQTQDLRRPVSPRKRLGPLIYAYGRPGVMHPCTITRRELIRSLGGFSTDLDIAADYELTLRVLQTSQVEVDQNAFAVFNLGGISTQRLRDSIREMKLARRRTLQMTKPSVFLDSAFYGYQVTRSALGSKIRKVRGAASL